MDDLIESVAKLLCRQTVESWGDGIDGYIARGDRTVDECVEQDWRDWLDDANEVLALIANATPLDNVSEPK